MALVLAALLAVTPAAAEMEFMLAECDSTILEVTVTSPSSNSLHSGDILIEWDAEGSASDLAKYDLFINVSGDSKEMLAEDLSGGNHTWDSTSYGDVQDATLAVRGKVDTLSTTCQDHDEITGVDIDNTAPSVDVTAPADGDLLEGDIEITWSTTDAHPDVVDVDYSIDNGTSWSDLHDGADDGSHTWDASGLPDADEVRVRVQATDGVGFTSGWTSTGSFSIDNEAPEATVTDPPGGATLEGTVTVAWDASDLHLDCVDLETRPSGGTWSTVETCSTAGEALLDTTTLEDGDHEIRVAAYDLLGHQGLSAPVSVSVDNLADDTLDGNGTGDSTDDGTDDSTDDSTSEGSAGDDTTSQDPGSTSVDERDAGTGVVDSIVAMPAPAMVALVVGAAIVVGAAVGLWLRRRE